MNEFSSLSQYAKCRLEVLSMQLTDVCPIETRQWLIATDSASYADDSQAIVDSAKAWAQDSSAFLYIFRLRAEDPPPVDVKSLFVRAKKAERNERAYARQNEPSTCLYVGGSRKLHQRLKEHLGFGATGTYALHLAHWATSAPLTISIDCAKYSESTSPEVLQSLEDTLWCIEKPMFGRQGAS